MFFWANADFALILSRPLGRVSMFGSSRPPWPTTTQATGMVVNAPLGTRGNDTMDNDTPQNRKPPLRSELRVRNPTLRRLVEGLLEHVRDLSGRVEELSADEVEQAQARFSLIAELMWAAIVDEKNKPDGELGEQ